ncbi:hypothetical protein F2P81_000258 [Scophthalmus maximus]|uniref:Uncharacterized protein n=1 Tax=Scophthalmus maximus TaxID=52904 RepID=A0A6A4TMT0_SCOMX|nr:hypothetical protein F2P81_000258 [Scophthalmus maximus]
MTVMFTDGQRARSDAVSVRDSSYYFIIVCKHRKYRSELAWLLITERLLLWAPIIHSVGLFLRSYIVMDTVVTFFGVVSTADGRKEEEKIRKLTWATTYATFGVLLLRSLCEIPVVRGPFDLLSWALMSTIKTVREDICWCRVWGELRRLKTAPGGTDDPSRCVPAYQTRQTYRV